MTAIVLVIQIFLKIGVVRLLNRDIAVNVYLGLMAGTVERPFVTNLDANVVIGFECHCFTINGRCGLSVTLDRGLRFPTPLLLVVMETSSEPVRLSFD